MIAYLIGSIPFGLVFSKIFKKNDPRESGSKNVGATNILRTNGPKIGFATLIFDVVKAFIPLKLCQIFHFDIYYYLVFFIFFGHIFSVWLSFKGGKGIAVMIGILLSYSLGFGLVFLISWLLIFVIFKYSSLSALIACLVIQLFAFTNTNQDHFFIIIFILNIFIFFKHRENIKRLLSGKESKIMLKK